MRWIDKINRAISLQCSLLIVCDPDNLMDTQSIRENVTLNGYEIINFIDPILFRYKYESMYRQKWKQGIQAKLLIILNKDQSIIDDILPYDVKEQSPGTTLIVNISLSEEFEKLSYPVVKQLDSTLLGLLYKEYVANEPKISKTLGDKETKDFIIKYVYKIDIPLDSIQNIISTLIYLHKSETRLSSYVCEDLITQIQHRLNLEKELTEKIVTDKTFFFEFLQKQWDKFVFGQENIIKFNSEYIEMTSLIKILFIEGKLKPIYTENIDQKLIAWQDTGVILDNEKAIIIKINSIISDIKNKIKIGNINYVRWIEIAINLSEIKFYINSQQITDEETTIMVEKVQKEIDERFSNWLLQNFTGLFSIPYTSRPGMVHHIPHYLSYRKRIYKEKIALIIFDGLSLSQWRIFKPYLKDNIKKIQINEMATFAWVPTLTNVSRQSIFSGKQPIGFKESIYRYDKEEKYWKEFWENEGILGKNVNFIEAGKSRNILDTIEEISSSPKLIQGIIIDTVDNLVHNKHFTMEQVFINIKYWLDKKEIIKLFEYLINDDYTIYIASDHGNVCACGIGRPGEGSLTISDGKRAITYDDARLREDAHKRLSNTIVWPQYGLPDNYFALLPKGNDAFISEGKQVITHGGISIEEVIVPFIRISKDV